MLLNYEKPVNVSSTYGGYLPNYAVDESIRSYWSAASGKPGEWIQTDLGKLSRVFAIQINYADQDVDSSFLGKPVGSYHQYRILQSGDGRNWSLLVDKSTNKTDVPHDYVELPRPVRTRYLKLVNLHIPTGKFAISGFRVFGRGEGPRPDTVTHFIVLRSQDDKRNGLIKWFTVSQATGYNIYFGTSSDKMYNSIMVYGDNQYYFKAMDKNRPYYFCIEAFNENGISERTHVLQVP
jgi:hypothetical protein